MAMPSSSKPATTDTAPAGRYHVARYGNTRNFALYDKKDLLAVTVYRKGAEAVQRELEARDTVIAEQAARIEQLTAANHAPGATRFQDKVQQGQAEQLGFFSRAQKEQFTAQRRGSKQHLANLRRKDPLRGSETTEISVRLGNYSASHFEGSALSG